mmetsp:Transcript_17397/g.25131  ORF Transcript_17397/g.25131 Transcript_17397/m.25131 type:complete len:464 (-) Transcript_17397:67-1458(-)
MPSTTKFQKNSSFWVICVVIVVTFATIFHHRNVTNVSSSGGTRGLQSRRMKGDHREVYHLRGLFFGTSRSWGSGLYHSKEAGEIKRYHAYPFKTTASATNLAVPGTGPLFPSMCLQSLVGDDLRVDYVVLEFFHIVSGGEAKLLDLAIRIRQRFPDAFLIFLIVPLPINFIHLPTAQTLSGRMGDGSYFNVTDIESLFEGIDEEFLDKVLAGTKDEEWKFELPEAQMKNTMQAVEAVGGHVWNPLKKGVTIKEQIKNIGPLFFHDASHFNVAGHGRIAWEIREMLADNYVKSSDRVNPWKLHDQCDSWYQDGHADKIQHSDMKMVRWAGRQKHALEVEEEGSWFEVTNPTDSLMKLYVYYMSTSPEQEYPKTSVQVSKLINQDTVSPDIECGAVILPMVSHDIFPDKTKRIHLVEGYMIGKVGRGTYRINLRPMPDQNKEYKKFRVTGIALTEGEGGDEVWLG